MPAPGPGRRLRIVAFFAAVLAGSALLLELVLQVGAIAVWLGRSEPAVAAAPGERVILCLGDSLTYGVGASAPDKGYPEQLEASLRASGAPARVVRSAFPGRSSREVLEELDGQLARYQPRLAYVLIGSNDRWVRPALLTLPAAAGPAPADGGGPAGGDDALVGGGGPACGFAPVDGPPPAPVAAGDGTAFRLEWRTLRLVKSVLGHLPANDPAHAAHAAHAAPAAAASLPVEDPWRAFGQKRLDVACRLWEQKVAAEPDRSHDARAGLVRTYRALGDAAREAAHLAWLRAAAQREEGTDAAFALLSALESTANAAERLALARQLTERFPDRPQPWDALAFETSVTGDSATALVAIDKAVALSAAEVPLYRAGILRRQSVIWRSADPRKSLRSFVDALVLGGVEAGPWGLPKCTQDELRAVLAEAGAEAEACAAIERLFAQTLGWAGDEVEAVLEAHLRQIVARCRSRGVEPVLVSYPHRTPWVENAMGRVARASGAAWVPVAEAFARRTAGTNWRDYFIADGHCSDAGHRILAEILAEDARGRQRE